MIQMSAVANVTESVDFQLMFNAGFTPELDSLRKDTWATVGLFSVVNYISFCREE
jgi:signal transduction protein with GAF and PtsI domain